MLMTSAVTVTLLMNIKPEFMEAFIEGLPELTRGTSSAAGALSVRVLRQHQDSQAICFVEQWENEAAFHAYIAWREARGDMAHLGQLLSAPPQINLWSSLSESP
ncbi:hypothetical protein C3F00_003390 [Pseudomonas sp. MWU13-2860]|nr:hypothetical protein C3F00_003390 [Pseudomonas sp. MWU13-2860]